jgi:tRNA-binding protein
MSWHYLIKEPIDTDIIMIITYDDFEKVDLRSGTVIKVEPFERVKKPAYKVWVNFGNDVGVLQTSAQITVHYTPESLIGKTVVGCINLGEKNIAGFISQFLLVGFSDINGAISLITTDCQVPNGQKLH